MFGGVAVQSTTSSLFGAGGSLFTNAQPLFGGANAFFKPAEQAKAEEDEDDDEEYGKGDGSPPAFVSSD